MARPKGTRRRSGNGEENKMVRLVDQLNAFERFKALIPPELQAELAKGTPPEKILKKFTNFAAARVVADAINPSSSTGAKSAREILDRVYGKPTERSEVINKYDNLTDEQLTALVKTKKAEVAAQEDELLAALDEAESGGEA